MKLPVKSPTSLLLLIAAAIMTIVIAGLIAFVFTHMEIFLTPKDAANNTKSHPQVHSATPATPRFNKSEYSLTDPSSLWVIINKQHPIQPKEYVPSDGILGRDGYQYSARIDKDLNALMDTAAQRGISFNISSAYRSYTDQATLFNNYIAQYGETTAETLSAHPGYSEHQTGLAVDIGGASSPDCNFKSCFGDTAEGKWLAAHANEFGFVIRYQKETTKLTGYSYEPWHIRYVGRALAAEYKKEGATSLEAFFGVTGGAIYAD